MAGYTAVHGTLEALESFFKQRLPAELSGGTTNASVKLLGSADIAKPINGNVLGIYAHRINVDEHGRARHFANQGANNSVPAGELPINIHFLLLAFSSSASIEADLTAWAMLELANQSQLTIAHLAEADPSWTERETINISPDAMSTEDLLRIWDVFDANYTSSVPYVARTIRLRLQQETTEGSPVMSRIFATGTAEHQA